MQNRSFKLGTEDDTDSAIGIWRTHEEVANLASKTGWQISFRKMSDRFYAAHYRYDVILTHED